MLRSIPSFADPLALVGLSTGDDAAVYQIGDTAFVATVDYITPVVDDPFAWGAIAATNALSDVYAMGGRPLFALNVVCFPRETIPLDVLGRVLEGGASKTAEAGIAILGGHSVDDPEPKYGLVVLGQVAPDRIVRNVGARAGDKLILTKPLGIGIVTTAIKQGKADPATIRETVMLMTTLNRAASEVAVESGAVHAMTDVTGFGLLGHLDEMLGSGSVGVEVRLHAVPVLAAVRSLAEAGMVPGGTRRNLASVGEHMAWDESIGDVDRLVLADAQTSGGLLVAVEPGAADAVVTRMRSRGVPQAAIIGVFTEHAGTLRVTV